MARVTISAWGVVMDKRTVWGQTAKLVDLAGSDAPLSTVLAEVVSAARVITRNECRAALFIHDLDEACLNLGVNGGLPDGYAEAMRYLATIASASIGRSKLRAAYEAELQQLPVDAPLPPPGQRSGQGSDALRRFVADGSLPPAK